MVGFGFMVPDVNHAHRIGKRTIIRSVSYHNRYWVYRIKSYRLLLYAEPSATPDLNKQQISGGGADLHC